MRIPRSCSRKTLAGLLVALVALAGLARSAGAVVVNEFQVPTAGSAPTSIVRGPDGNLWFTEFSADRIGRITPTGGVTEFVLAAGRGPLAITTGSDNLLYFTERLADRIGRLNPLAGSNAAIQASLVEFLVPGVGSGPHGIASGPDGALWFTEFGSDEIGRLTTAGVITEFAVPGAGSGPAGITAGPDGALWFTQAGSSQIGRITTGGFVTTEFFLAPFSDPEEIAAGPDGAIWFTSFGSDRVVRILGGAVTEFSLGFDTGPLGITAGPDNALWSALAVSGRIARVTTEGLFTTFPLPTPLSQPNGITTGPDGALWFTELAGNQIGRLFRLELLLTGAGAGGGPHVRAIDVTNPASPTDRFSFFAFVPSFTGGVRVALSDVNGDGVPDIIVGAGPGGGPHVIVFSGLDLSILRSFFAYAPGFTGGVFVASGDVDGDGRADIVTGAGPGGGPHVRVFSGATGAELSSFFAYDPGFTGGVSVAAGDVNGDGRADIITGAGPGGGPHVKAFSGANLALLHNFFAYNPAFTGGVFVGAGDVSGDGRADIVTGAGPGGGPHVRVFSGATGVELLSFFAFVPQFTGGVRVAAGDVNGDGRADVVAGAGPGGGPHVEVFRSSDLALLHSFFAYNPAFTGGVFVAK